MKKPLLVKTELDETIAELAYGSDHRTLGIWAVDCAERVLHFFEDAYPEDDRPRKAIEALRKWIKTGVFKMNDVRRSSLSAHASARAILAIKDSADSRFAAARSAARSAGQAIATAHVPSHSIVAAIYAASAIRDATDQMDAVNKERKWQYKRLLSLRKKNPTTTQNLWRTKQ